MDAREAERPLADRMRPRTLDEFVGQSAIVGPGKLLRRAIQADRLTSCIFYGPPGTGKTTLAAIIAGATKGEFVRMNAVTSGVADVRSVLAEAETRLGMYGKPTYLLLDECHRWSKSQSDSILPAIERGVVRFIGSTTENPMAAMTPAIVSRCRLFRFTQLTEADILSVLRRALTDAERGIAGMNAFADEDALRHIARVSGGDARSALNALELAAITTPMDENGRVHITLSVAEESIQQSVLRVDESLYYDMLSAFCKSLRGSDSDAALAWCARLLRAGIDPRIIVRRVIAHASEDVGLANPTAMLQAVAAGHALEMIGMPEARLSITQAIIAVCESPKSNSVVVALEKSAADAEKATFEGVPSHLRDPSYDRNKETGYKYPHDYPGHYVRQVYAPQDARGMPYYVPSDQGQEEKLALRKAAREQSGNGNP